METIVVNDTNIFIDLCKINLLNEFFDLPLQIHTTDFVIGELEEEDQKERVLAFHMAQKLFIKSHSAKEVAEIAAFQAECKNNVSIADCSVWLYSKQNQFLLVTGDNKLRRSAIASGTAVCGILYIFNLLVEHAIISPQQCIDKLNELSDQNIRLPGKEIDKLLKYMNSLIDN